MYILLLEGIYGYIFRTYIRGALLVENCEILLGQFVNSFIMSKKLLTLLQAVNNGGQNNVNIVVTALQL